MIFKIVNRSMKKKFGLVIAISILIILSSFFVGLNFFTYKSLDYDYTQMTDVSNVEDFRLYEVGSFHKKYDENLINKIQKDENVNLELKKTLYYNQKEDNKISYEINRFSDDTKINKMILEDGQLPENVDEIVVLPEFLVDNNLKIGDSVTIADHNYTISGSAYFSDYIVAADYMHGMIAPDFTKFALYICNQQVLIILIPQMIKLQVMIIFLENLIKN